LAITPEEAKNIESIEFNGIDVDDEFGKHWLRIFSGPTFTRPCDPTFHRLSFDKCNFSDDGVYIFHNVHVADIAIKNCGITVDQAEVILHGVDPYSVGSIDLSYNDFEKEQDRFYEVICRTIGCGGMGLNTLDLRGNKLSPDAYKDLYVGKVLF
jgi:hypothetical protein